MVFYNKILKAYVLIDLKMDGLKPEYAGYGKPDVMLSVA
jgi:predicted nuclease of restriction endonuclease-like (RecB) superfamily